MKPIHLLLILVVNLAWGFNIVPTKLALDHIPPITATFVRSTMVAVLLAPMLRWIPGQMAPIFGYAMIGGAMMFVLANAGFAKADNVTALAIAGQLGVPFSLILAIIFLGERIRFIRTIGILLAFAGVAVLSFDPHIFDERIALLLTVGSSFCYAVGTILLRRLRGIPPLVLQSWLGVFCLGPTFMFSLIMEPGAIAALPRTDISAFGYLLLSAVTASIIGHTSLAYLLQRYPIMVISPLTLLAPLLAVFFSVVLLGNLLTPQLIIGGLITLAGVAIITIRGAQKSTDP